MDRIKPNHHWWYLSKLCMSLILVTREWEYVGRSLSFFRKLSICFLTVTLMVVLSSYGRGIYNMKYLYVFQIVLKFQVLKVYSAFYLAFFSKKIPFVQKVFNFFFSPFTLLFPNLVVFCIGLCHLHDWGIYVAPANPDMGANDLYFCLLAWHSWYRIC